MVSTARVSLLKTNANNRFAVVPVMRPSSRLERIATMDLAGTNSGEKPTFDEFRRPPSS